MSFKVNISKDQKTFYILSDLNSANLDRIPGIRHQIVNNLIDFKTIFHIVFTQVYTPYRY
jgi:hypothetical protein